MLFSKFPILQNIGRLISTENIICIERAQKILADMFKRGKITINSSFQK